jgi:hypothetical protein
MWSVMRGWKGVDWVFPACFRIYSTTIPTDDPLMTHRTPSPPRPSRQVALLDRTPAGTPESASPTITTTRQTAYRGIFLLPPVGNARNGAVSWSWSGQHPAESLFTPDCR